MKSMKLFLVLLTAVLLSSSAYAQKSGWSLLFSWDRFNAAPMQLGSVVDVDEDETDFGGIGVELQLAPQFALQVGLHLNMASSERQLSSTTTREFSRTEYAISLAPVWYPKGYVLSGVRPYAGAAISFGGLSTTLEDSGPSVSGKAETSASSLAFGVFGGADFMVIDGLRVGAGYGLFYLSYPAGTYQETGSPEVEGPSSSAFTDVFHLTCKILF